MSFRAGRGIVSDEHPLGLTLPAGHRLWPQVDLVIGIGSRMMEPLQHWGTPAGLKVVRIDIDPAELNRHGAPDVGIAADSALTLRALVPALERVLGSGRRPALEVAAAKQAVATEIQQIQPQLSFLGAIRSVLPRDGIFCDEITQCGFASWYGFPVYAPRQHINCGYQGTLGYGYATALGVKVAHPERAVVSIAGDGGFLFNVQEMATAVQYGIGLKTIVFNSNSFGNVQRQQREWFGERLIGSDLRNPDFLRLAEAFGMPGHRAQHARRARARPRALPRGARPGADRGAGGRDGLSLAAHHPAAAWRRSARVTAPVARPGVMMTAAYVPGERAIEGVAAPIKLSSNESPHGPGRARSRPTGPRRRSCSATRAAPRRNCGGRWRRCMAWTRRGWYSATARTR